MKTTYTNIIAQLEQTLDQFVLGTKALSKAELQSQPSGGWTVHQIIAHTTDVETLAFLPRVKLALANSGAVCQIYSPDEWMRERYKADLPASELLRQFRTTRRAFVKLLSGCENADWRKFVMHPQYGQLTMEILATHAVTHTFEHLTELWRAKEQSLGLK